MKYGMMSIDAETTEISEWTLRNQQRKTPAHPGWRVHRGYSTRRILDNAGKGFVANRILQEHVIPDHMRVPKAVCFIARRIIPPQEQETEEESSGGEGEVN
jgi:hypothetical protein